MKNGYSVNSFPEVNRDDVNFQHILSILDEINIIYHQDSFIERMINIHENTYR